MLKETRGDQIFNTTYQMDWKKLAALFCFIYIYTFIRFDSVTSAIIYPPYDEVNCLQKKIGKGIV